MEAIMTDKRLVPYNVYLHAEHVAKLKELAGDRKASSMVRDAISTVLDGKEEYSAGYNRGLRECVDIINRCKEIEHIAVRGKYLADVLIGQIEALEKK